MEIVETTDSTSDDWNIEPYLAGAWAEHFIHPASEGPQHVEVLSANVAQIQVVHTCTICGATCTTAETVHPSQLEG